jgi:hypothetical protein
MCRQVVLRIDVALQTTISRRLQHNESRHWRSPIVQYGRIDPRFPMHRGTPPTSIHRPLGSAPERTLSPISRRKLADPPATPFSAVTEITDGGRRYWSSKNNSGRNAVPDPFARIPRMQRGFAMR